MFCCCATVFDRFCFVVLFCAVFVLQAREIENSWDRIPGLNEIFQELLVHDHAMVKIRYDYSLLGKETRFLRDDESLLGKETRFLPDDESLLADKVRMEVGDLFVVRAQRLPVLVLVPSLSWQKHLLKTRCRFQSPTFQVVKNPLGGHEPNEELYPGAADRELWVGHPKGRPDQVRTRIYFAPFLYKNDHFTETGSGQTQAKHSNSKTEMRFSLQMGLFPSACVELLDRSVRKMPFCPPFYTRGKLIIFNPKNDQFTKTGSGQA
eukprot:COSAG06_NODE_858_length_11909_cov_6.018036_6_plen_264_part_00